jgi:hypothetical protein
LLNKALQENAAFLDFVVIAEENNVPGFAREILMG